VLADGGSIPPASTKQRFNKIQRSTKTRKLYDLAGFLLSNEMRWNIVTVDNLCSNIYSNTSFHSNQSQKLLHELLYL